MSNSATAANARTFGQLPFETTVNPGVVGSRALRYLLVAELLRSPHPMSPSQLAERVQQNGLTIRGRATKTVSDALRWETAKGRVIKLGRGRYVIGAMPKSTKSWIRSRAAAHYQLAAREKSLQG